MSSVYSSVESMSKVTHICINDRLTDVEHTNVMPSPNRTRITVDADHGSRESSPDCVAACRSRCIANLVRRTRCSR